MTPGFYRRRGARTNHDYLSAGIRVDEVLSSDDGLAVCVVGRALHRTAVGWSTGDALSQWIFPGAFEPMAVAP